MWQLESIHKDYDSVGQLCMLKMAALVFSAPLSSSPWCSTECSPGSPSPPANKCCFPLELEEELLLLAWGVSLRNPSLLQIPISMLSSVIWPSKPSCSRIVNHRVLRIEKVTHLEGENSSVHGILELQVLRVPGREGSVTPLHRKVSSELFIERK